MMARAASDSHAGCCGVFRVVPGTGCDAGFVGKCCDHYSIGQGFGR